MILEMIEKIMREDLKSSGGKKRGYAPDYKKKSM